MNDQPTISIPQSEETTGRYVVTFREEGEAEGMTLLKKQCGTAILPSVADFEESALDTAQIEAAGGACFQG